MAIEIKELVVRLRVDDTGQKPVKDQHNSQSYDEKKIVDTCVEKVLRRLESKKER